MDRRTCLNLQSFSDPWAKLRHSSHSAQGGAIPCSTTPAEGQCHCASQLDTYHVLRPLAAPGHRHHLQLGIVRQIGKSPLEREVEHSPLKPAEQTQAQTSLRTRTLPTAPSAPRAQS